MYRQGEPVRTIQRMALKISRRSCSRCGASSFISVRYGATKSHSSSVTSLGYGFLAMQAVPHDHRESSEHALEYSGGKRGDMKRNFVGVVVTVLLGLASF